ncbi:unnamed protein product, partial [Candidula unifasciata]
IELEVLNQAAIDINRLEREIDESRAKYQSTFLESSQQLEMLKKKFSASIKRARPYYELQDAYREAQNQALRSARKFQTSNGIYLAAKETFSLAELRLMDDKAASLSPAWQEMLNLAVLRITEAEKEKSANEQEHLKRAAVFSDIEKKMHMYEKKHKRSIAKARSYFETKKELDIKLQQLKQTVEDLQQAFKAAKQRYSGALKHLEQISNSIHEQRRQNFLLMFPREPGVGAEDNKSTSEAEPSFPTLSTSDDVDSVFDDTEGDEYDKDSGDNDEEDGGYQDINNESVFRARVLTTALDNDDTSFMRLKYGRKRRDKKQVKRTQSLPLYPGRRAIRSEEVSSLCSSPGSEAGFPNTSEKPLVPLSDRSDNYPPDGDSLSSEKNIVCDISSCDSTDNIDHDIRPSSPFMHFDTFMTKSSLEIFEPAIIENSKKMLESIEPLEDLVIGSSHEDIQKVSQEILAEDSSNDHVAVSVKVNDSPSEILESESAVSLLQPHTNNLSETAMK